METIYECETINDVYEKTDLLDKATLVDLKMDDSGIIKDVTNYKGVYNISKGKFAAAVAKQYNLITHKEYFDACATALNRLNIKFKMTLKQSGNRAFADIEFQDKNLKFDKLDEEFTTGIRLVNSYDKSTGLYAMPRFTRLACTNGMIITRSEKTISIKHHSKVLKEIDGFVEKRINEIINNDSHLKMWVSASIEDSAEWKICCRIVEKLFKEIKHREEILKKLDISIIQVKDKKTKKKSVTYVVDKEEDKKKKITRWDLYNAITNYLTHGEHITPHIENLFHKQAQKLLDTPLKKMPMAKVTI